MLLQTTERHCETYKDELLSIQEERKDQDIKIDQLGKEKTQLLLIAEEHDKLVCIHQEQLKRLEELESNFINVTHNNEALKDKVLSLDSHVHSLQNELKWWLIL
jgi:predicted nuclease with TOPRIM domain